MNGEARIVIVLENGQLSVTANVPTTELVGLLEAAKMQMLAAAGVGREVRLSETPNETPITSARTPGLLTRQVA
jgi:hypothetical protein